MKIKEEQKRDILILHTEGRLNASTAPVLEDKLLGAADRGGKKIILNFAGLDYISSAGLRVLLMGAKKMKEAEGRLVLAGVQPQVKDVFEVAGFIALFPMFESVEQAEEELK